VAGALCLALPHGQYPLVAHIATTTAPWHAQQVVLCPGGHPTSDRKYLARMYLRSTLCFLRANGMCWQEADKRSMEDDTGLSSIQINNWFINQRKRHWHKVR
jgi:hypothetical protein